MDLDEIKEKIEETLKNIKINYSKLKVDEWEYEERKTEYELSLLDLKYSEEYAQYKTIKEKEERAKLAMQEEKKELTYLKNKINVAKYNLERYNINLRYLFRLYDEGVINDD